MAQEIGVRGIILAVFPQGEFGKRLTVLTDGLGKVTVFASGAAKTSSHVIGKIRPFTAAAFTLVKSRGAYSLHGIELMDAFQELATDLDAVCYGMYVLETADYVSEEGMHEQEAKALLNLMYVTFCALREKKLPCDLIRALYELRLLVLQGEYTTEPPQSSREETKETRALWSHALNSGLSGLYCPEEALLGTETCGAFERSAGLLFHRQLPHSFRALKVLPEL